MAQASLTVADLNEQLDDLVEWEIFGTYLRGIKSKDVTIIERIPNHARQKIALFNKWLSVCPDATWSDVVIALEKAQEFTLAEQVKSQHNNQQCDGRQMKEIKLTEMEEITIISKLNYFNTTFSDLLTRTRKDINDLAQSNKLSLEEIKYRLKDEFQFMQEELTKCKTITEIFDTLREHSHFLDGSILNKAMEKLFGESPLLQDIKDRVQEFKMLQPIKTFKNKLADNNIRENHTPIKIKLNNAWEEVQIGLVKHLIKILLQLKGDIQWISITSGSVQIIIYIPKEQENRIINTCSQKEHFIKQMGIFNLQIGTNTILDTKENNHYSFELGLLEACAVGNIETVQFLLHYQFLQHISVNINHTNEQGKTPLMIASENGHRNIVKLLLSAQANVNKQDDLGRTAVMLAKTIEIYQTLVQANADITIVTHKGSTPLYISCLLGNHEVAEHLLFTLKHDITTRPDGFTLLMAASEGGNYRIVQYLLEKEHDPNTQDCDGQTALGLACLPGHYTVTELLLKYKADPNLPIHDGWTPLMAASQEGHIKIVELLLQNGVDPNVTNTKNGTTALILASEDGHHDTVELLLMKGADPNIQLNDGGTAIEQACLYGHYTITKLLLKHKANPNLIDDYGWTPLLAASGNGHHKIVELLLPRVIDLTAVNMKNGLTALMLASLNGHYETVNVLLKAGHDSNARRLNGDTAILQASRNGHYTVTELLLDNNADPNLADYEGRTPLMIASQNGHYKIVQLLLLQKGVTPNITNSETGTTPLIYATENGHHDTVEVLLKAGGNPNIQNKDGRSAIELASLYGHVRIVQLLLNYNANPNLHTNEGWTPLMAASQEGYTNIVELLLQKGVDPNVRNKRNGRTALIQASKNGHYETVQLLLKAGCDSSIEVYEGHTATEQAHDEVLELLQNTEPDQRLPSTDRQLVPPPKT